MRSPNLKILKPCTQSFIINKNYWKNLIAKWNQKLIDMSFQILFKTKLILMISTSWFMKFRKLDRLSIFRKAVRFQILFVKLGQVKWMRQPSLQIWVKVNIVWVILIYKELTFLILREHLLIDFIKQAILNKFQIKGKLKK